MQLHAEETARKSLRPSLMYVGSLAVQCPNSKGLKKTPLVGTPSN